MRNAWPFPCSAFVRGHGAHEAAMARLAQPRPGRVALLLAVLRARGSRGAVGVELVPLRDDDRASLGAGAGGSTEVGGDGEPGPGVLADRSAVRARLRDTPRRDLEPLLRRPSGRRRGALGAPRAAAS